MTVRTRIIGGLLLVASFGLLAFILATLGRGGSDLGLTTAADAAPEPAPPLILPTLDGEAEAVDLRDIVKDGPVVVNFWASWCAPCRIEHPILMRLEREGVRIIGVAYRDRPADSRAFLASLGDPFALILKDENGQAGLDWAVTGVPESFLVTPDAMVAAHFRGPLTPDGAAPFLDEIEAAQAAADRVETSDTPAR